MVPTSITQRTLALGALTVFAVSCVYHTDSTLVVRGTPALAGLAFAITGLFYPGPGAVVAILAFAIQALVLTKLVWQAVMPLAMAFVFLCSRRSMIKPYIGMPRGSVPGWATFACGAVTPLFLVAWVILFRPDVTDLKPMVPNFATPLLVAGSVGFAIVNALFEEWIWRGVFQSCLMELFPRSFAVEVQAFSFGMVHLYGFPRGIVGVLLAGTWAILLGILRIKSGGLSAPFLAHFVADLTIAFLMIFWFR